MTIILGIIIVILTVVLAYYYKAYNDAHKDFDVLAAASKHLLTISNEAIDRYVAKNATLTKANEEYFDSITLLENKVAKLNRLNDLSRKCSEQASRTIAELKDKIELLNNMIADKDEVIRNLTPYKYDDLPEVLSDTVNSVVTRTKTDLEQFIEDNNIDMNE